MTADEALRECARTVARVMLDLKFDASEAADAEEIIVNGSKEALRASILADVIEPGGVRFRLFVAHDDDHAKHLLELARENGASVSTSCTLFDAVQSAWRRRERGIARPTRLTN
jgi:hypothetical protein